MRFSNKKRLWRKPEQLGILFTRPSLHAALPIIGLLHWIYLSRLFALSNICLNCYLIEQKSFLFSQGNNSLFCYLITQFDEMFSGAELMVPALLLAERHLFRWSSRITPRYFWRLPLLLCWLWQDFRSQHVALKYVFKECCQV